LSHIFRWSAACWLSFTFLCPFTAAAQNQQTADSLVVIYLSGDFPDSAQYDLLNEIAFHSTNPEISEKYSRKLIQLAEKSPDDIWKMRGFLQLGNAQSLQGDLNSALESFFKSLEFARKAGEEDDVGAIHISIADTYSQTGNSPNAIKYYYEGIGILRENNDSISLGKALLNIGDEYFNNEKYDSALLFFEESESIFENQGLPTGIAYNLGNKGMVYAKTGQNGLAELSMDKAIQILEDLKDYYPISVYLIYMSDIYMEKGEVQKSIDYATSSLRLAEQYGLKKQISDSNKKLSELYSTIGKTDLSFEHYKAYVLYRDSVNNIEMVQEMANLRTDYEVSQKQIEVDLLNQRQENQRIVLIATVSIAVLILLLAFGLAHRYRYIRRTSKIIENEKNRSDKLLLNILPEDTAEELKSFGKVKAKKFDSATVLFSDFKEFTKTAESLSPEQLVASIDYYFKAFDEITSKYGLEKIKTIGDSYMCAGGVPVESGDHALRIVRAAVEMLEFTEQQNANNDDLVNYEVRIGIHTGPVIAGIVGHKKWQYDIWGDTVNIASRMESNSLPGKINISESTHRHIKDYIDCEFRGKIEVKNRGALKMYFLNGMINELKPAEISSKPIN